MNLHRVSAVGASPTAIKDAIFINQDRINNLKISLVAYIVGGWVSGPRKKREKCYKRKNFWLPAQVCRRVGMWAKKEE